MDNPTYDIQQLVDLSGVPRRNIYFYVQQGLLPPPSGAGLAARYAEEHLLRLSLIPALRRQGLRLDQIRARLSGLGLPELRELQDRLARPVEPPQPPVDARPLPPAGLACRRYDLPGGIQLLVPDGLDPLYQPLLARLLSAAGQ